MQCNKYLHPAYAALHKQPIQLSFIERGLIFRHSCSVVFRGVHPNHASIRRCKSHKQSAMAQYLGSSLLFRDQNRAGLINHRLSDLSCAMSLNTAAMPLDPRIRRINLLVSAVGPEPDSAGSTSP
jgi:hypothetical protein